ncbi:glycosyltransferase family 59 protein [Polychaeton citri CBS 116435]|uniref:Dol-P-Glc:Glc(2)Man(9)GlcNAc(2)-PP-Dol alpha-1,2-glucosyltransferase n=1 Tax=Polychaeton citri CBS 116435 TaxID=1314669 RepID=A0A9P4UL83_9PEZI|nr:glycosyltransferase family 59 protein [Polychaeton citri CBS 116435]
MDEVLASCAFVLPCAYWATQVIDTVSTPYLDEVFHVRQAQHYCRGNYDIWDPKITTPPGLYVISSYLANVWPFSDFGCNLSGLRLQSTFLMMALWVLLGIVDRAKAQRSDKEFATNVLAHSRANIALFPPLFFFSTLYYTDVASTFSVLAFHHYFVSSHYNRVPTWRRTPILVGLGLLSLTFRQTNVFWIAVFPAVVTLAFEIDTGHQEAKMSMYQKSGGFGDGWTSITKTSWRFRVLFDPPVRDASLEDYGKTFVSMVACTLSSLTTPQRFLNVFDAMAPFIVLISSFIGFVVWNGGVVLGDKSNHVATLHLPQMLYIWPYIVFFSWPLVYSSLLVPPLAIVTKFTTLASLESMLLFRRRHFLPRVRLLVAAISIVLLVINFNTVIHPFTLADNRHYTFYVFRLLIRPRWMRYLAAPVYVICGWACIQSLGAAPSDVPAAEAVAAATKASQDEAISDALVFTKRNPKSLPLPDGEGPATTIFAMIWLGCTTLQLVTAPLVEPRYFILPWIFWRMHIPIRQRRPLPATGDRSTPRSLLSRFKRRYWDAYDHRLHLETMWLLAINAATGYIFLSWTFNWRQEPGQIQRFMW